MKRITLILFLLLSIIVMTACESAHEKQIKKLKKEIAEVNAVCPINVGIAGDVISMKYDDKSNTVSVYYAVNEDISGHLFLNQNQENMKKQLRLLFSHKEGLPIIKDIVKAKASFSAKYKAISSGKTVEFTLPYAELKDMVDHPLADNEINRMILDNSVVMQNASLPSDIGDGMTVTKVEIVGDKVIYHTKLNEDLISVKLLKNKSKEFKMVLEEYFKSMREDQAFQRDFNMMYSLGLGYTCRYFGDKSKDSVDITFSADELKDLMTE